MKTLIILAGGRSSRMKNSVNQAELSDPQKLAARNLHKSLIPLGVTKAPLLSLLCDHAQQAGTHRIVIVTAPDNEAFHLWRTAYQSNRTHLAAIDFAIQQPINGKPLGTADAVLSAFEAFPELQKSRVAIANGDNLYSAKAISIALEHQHTPHALIAYEAAHLGFDPHRIASFALIKVDHKNRVIAIVEKPEVATHAEYKDSDGNLRVSMNLISVWGPSFYKALKACPIHPLRGEKELPEAIRIAIDTDPLSVYCHLVFERLPDLTSAADLQTFS